MKKLETVTYYGGKDVKNMSRFELIDGIKDLEGDIKGLQEVGTESRAIAAEINKRETMIAELVKILDAGVKTEDAPAPTAE